MDQAEYDRIAELIHSESSPVDIDAKKTHILILQQLQRIEEKLDELLAASNASRG